MSISAEEVATTPQDRLQARLADPDTIDSLNRLLDRVELMAFVSGMLDPKLVRVLGDVGHRLAGAYSDAASKPVQPVGALGLFRALGEPEVQRAMGLLVAVARRFGRDLR